MISGISCSCDFDGDGYIFTSRICTARQLHKCDECGVDINPGQLMDMAIWYKAEESGGSCKRCGFCFTLDERMGGCTPYHGLRDQVETVLIDNNQADLDKFFGKNLVLELKKRFELPSEC